MGMFDKLDYSVMFVSFCVGLAFVYVFQQSPEVTVVWPNPDRAGKTAYERDDGTCYAYDAKKVDCKE